MCEVRNRPHIKHGLQTQLSAGTRIQQEIVIWLQFSVPSFRTLLSSWVLRWLGLRECALAGPFFLQLRKWPFKRRFEALR